MRAGSLDRRVVFWRARTETDDLNEDVPVWYPLTPAGVYASRRDVSDGERVAAQAVGAVIGSRFQTRYSSRLAALTPADRLTCEGRTFDIVGVKSLGRREGLEISAVASADDDQLTAEQIAAIEAVA